MLQGALLVAVAAFILLQAGVEVSAFIVRPSITSAVQFTRSLRNLNFVMSGADDQSAEVIVVGSCNTDLVTYTPRLPSRGETAP